MEAFCPRHGRRRRVVVCPVSGSNLSLSHSVSRATTFDRNAMHRMRASPTRNPMNVRRCKVEVANDTSRERRDVIIDKMVAG